MITTDTKAALQEYIDSLGLEYTATFIPTPQPTAEPYPKLHWVITLSINGVTASFPYFQGIGHIKGYKQYYKSPIEERKFERMARRACETGIVYELNDQGEYVSPERQPCPQLVDVLHCLVRDASARHYATYEEWASDYGYDQDSRKGEAIYHACRKQTVDLERVLSGGKLGRWCTERLEKLEELYQEY